MSSNVMFLQLTKIDAEHRLVHGRAAQEMVDTSNEVFDYATSKPYFEQWSEVAKSATGGSSLGNLRAMHGKIAAGKLTEIEFNDAEKSIDVVVKVVDDSEWKKCLEGVYTGFSIGGSYEKRWSDGAATRYTANPTELSLVDRPCIPSAKFYSLRKADGSEEQMQFLNVQTEVTKVDDKTVPETPAVNEYEVAGTDADLASLAKFMAANSLSVSDVLAKMADMSMADKDAIEMSKAQAAHDQACIDGAVCKAEKFENREGSDALAKVSADEILTKRDDQLSKLESANIDLNRRLTELERQPFNRVSLRAVPVEKSLDAVSPDAMNKIEPVIIGGNENETASLIKSAHRSGGRSLRL